MRVRRSILASVLVATFAPNVFGAGTPGAPDSDAFRYWRQTLPTPRMLLGLTFGEGKLIAVGNGIHYSTNGTPWLPAVIDAGGVLWNVLYADERFVAVGRGSRAICNSSNGIDWTVRVSMPEPYDLLAVAFGNGVWVAGGTEMRTSTDHGLSWSPTPQPQPFICSGLFFGDGKFVATGRTRDFPLQGVTAVSTNGIDWSVTIHPTLSSLLSGTWHKGRFFAIGGDAILVSDDAVNWTTARTPSVSVLSAIVAHDDQYVTVGLNVILGSTNGLDWELVRQIEWTNVFRDVIVADNTFAAVYEVNPTSASAIYLSDPFNSVLPFFVEQPSDTEQRIGLATNLTAKAEGSSPIAYQWQRNGVDIPGATGSQLAFDPLERQHDGTYRVIARNDVGETISGEALLTVGLPPKVLVSPVSQSVPAGGAVTFSALIEGTPPITNRWRKPRSIFITQELHQASTFLRVENAQPADAGTYGVILANRYGGAMSEPATLTVVADADGDGLPDDWEQQNGVTDPAADSDGDGLTDIQEYQSGTDPRDPQSYLRVERIAAAPNISAVILSFLARSNQTYTIQSRERLASGAWQRLLDVVASSSDRLITATNVIAGNASYFRLVTPRTEAGTSE